MPRRLLVGRVEDWVIEEGVRHGHLHGTGKKLRWDERKKRDFHRTKNPHCSGHAHGRQKAPLEVTVGVRIGERKASGEYLECVARLRLGILLHGGDGLIPAFSSSSYLCLLSLLFTQHMPLSDS
jgi:hypothetical protein